MAPRTEVRRLVLVSGACGGIDQAIVRAATAMGLVVHFARPLFAGFSELPALLGLVALGVVTQLVMVLLVDRERLREARVIFATRK